MWMRRWTRFALPALQRSSSSMVFQSLRACRRPLQLTPPLSSCLLHRGQHTLGSASLPELGRAVRYVQALHNERLVQVEWEDGGHSLRAVQEELFLNERLHWDSSLRMPTAHFQEVLQDDKAALAWLLALRRVGVVYLQGAPQQPGQVARLAERIGYLRLTFYGHTWKVQDKQMANNVAYTAEKFSFHTDYPALHYPPGVQILHCINQAARGGENTLVDGFHVAEKLKAEDPEAFHSLTTQSIDFTDTGTDYCDFMLQSKHRIIDVDADGTVTRINLNNSTRDSVLDLPLEQVQPFYRALRAFEDMMNREENMVTVRMEPGDIVTFDNWRLLHGRTGFISHPDKPRFLEGCYLDWDEVMSRLRILRRTLEGDK